VTNVLTIKVRRLLERNLQNIGTLPMIISRLMRVLNDPKSSASDLASIIAMDQVLSSRLLRMVNSAYFGLSKEVIDIQQAVGLVGYNVIRSFTFCITLFDNLDWKSGGVTFNKVNFWLHSLGVGVISRHVAKKFRLRNADDYFVAGVMHDIGKVFMLQFMTSKFFKTLETAQRYDMSFYETEKTLLDIDHAEIGSWALTKWEIPRLLIDCTNGHHHPIKKDNNLFPPEVIALSNCISKEMKIGFGGDYKTGPEYALLKLKYEIDRNWIDSIQDGVKNEVNQFAQAIKDKDRDKQRMAN